MQQAQLEAFMRRAIELGRKSGIEERAGGPFGAVIVKNGEVVAEAGSRVLVTPDATAHSEVLAIREACLRLKTHDLSGCVMFASGQPCEMCSGGRWR